MHDVATLAQPNFLIIGGQKCGTTALHHFLSSHPDITPAKIKEVHFFDQDAHFAKGTLWYHLHFPRIDPTHRHTLKFEATPHYLSDPSVPQRIHQYNHQLKLIVLLRNPVERAYSAWNMHATVMRGRALETIQSLLHNKSAQMETLNADVQAGVGALLRDGVRPFGVMVREEICRLTQGDRQTYPDYVQRGLYYEQLRRYFDYFPREQMLIVESNALKLETSDTLDTIANFLGIRPAKWIKQQLHSKRATYARPLDEATRELLQTFFAPHNQRLYTLLGRDFGW